MGYKNDVIFLLWSSHYFKIHVRITPMKRKNIQEILVDLNDRIDAITDINAKVVIKVLLNLIEHLTQELDTLEETNEKLHDEINRLKGEQGKPNVRPQADKKDISSEKDRKPKKKKKAKSKNKKNKIVINRTVKCAINQERLPDDAIFKGYQSVVIQDLDIKTDNIKFRKEVYYSPSMRKTFIAHLPKGYQGEFGPNIKALILSLHSDSKMTEPAIVNFLAIHGIRISAATVSRIITDHHELFHQEKADIVQAGLPSTIYQQMDDTSARVNGRNHYTHILCNEYYTAYFTRPRKDRLTVLEILSQNLLTFCFNESAYALMEQMGLPNRAIEQLRAFKIRKIMNRQEVDVLVKKIFPDPDKHHKNRHIILEASGIVAYQRSSHAVPLLLTDDAPQFKQITGMLALCWIHGGRHYKKLDPMCSRHIKKREEFVEKYWDFYHKLLNYKQSPTPVVAKKLRNEFRLFFSQKTGYDQLDERIQRTYLKADSLLFVLKYPEIPLHNNAAELGARVQARYRDISFQTKNKKGTEAKDTFMTIVATAKKLGVNAFLYIKDRVSQQFEMPALADLVAAHNSS